MNIQNMHRCIVKHSSVFGYAVLLLAGFAFGQDYNSKANPDAVVNAGWEQSRLQRSELEIIVQQAR